MGSQFRMTVLACGIATALVACASTSQVPSAAKKVTPATPVSAAAPAKVATKKGGAAEGYRQVTKSGTVYYCKKEGFTGSRLETTETCLTEAQMERQRQNTVDMMSRIHGDPGYTGPVNGQGGQMIGPVSQ